MVRALTGLVLVDSGEWRKGLSGAALTMTALSDFTVMGPVILALTVEQARELFSAQPEIARVLGLSR